MANSVEYLVAKAVFTKFSGTSALTTAMPGGLHQGKAKGLAGATALSTPYAVFSVDVNKNKCKLMASGDKIDCRVVTFQVWGNSSSNDTVDAAVKALRDAFHAQPLTDTSPTFTAISVLEVPVDMGQFNDKARRAGEAQWQGTWACEVVSAI